MNNGCIQTKFYKISNVFSSKVDFYKIVIYMTSTKITLIVIIREKK